MAEQVEVGTEAWARSIESPYTAHWTKKPHSPDRCCASVHDEGRSVGFHQCVRKPFIFYGSLGYCKQHDPVASIARNTARQEKWAAEGAARDAARKEATRKSKLRNEALAAIKLIALGHNDPRSLALDLLTANDELIE